MGLTVVTSKFDLQLYHTRLVHHQLLTDEAGLVLGRVAVQVDDLDGAERLQPVAVRHPEVPVLLQASLQLENESTALTQKNSIDAKK